jgi:hypothetical protein
MYHLAIDLSDCDSKRMSSKSELNALISTIVSLAKMKAVGNPMYIHEIKT